MWLPFTQLNKKYCFLKEKLLINKVDFTLYNITVLSKPYRETELLNSKQFIYSFGPPEFTIEAYENLGK